MSKIGEREIQLREMRERQFAPPIKSKVLRQPPLRSRARPATEKTLAQASAESTDAGGMQDRCVSIPPPIKPKRGRPLAKDKAATFEATKPWIAEGLSRATWFRYRRNVEKTK